MDRNALPEVLRENIVDFEAPRAHLTRHPCPRFCCVRIAPAGDSYAFDLLHSLSGR